MLTNKSHKQSYSKYSSFCPGWFDTIQRTLRDGSW